MVRFMYHQNSKPNEVIIIYNSRYLEISQEPPMLAVPLADRGRNGKERPWRRYKMANELLSIAYESIDQKKADRLKWCCKTIEADVKRSTGELVRIVGFSSCRVRLCPLCSWRRSLKNYWNTMRIIRWLQSQESRPEVGKFDYIFITLTIKNCTGDDLSASIDNLFSSVKRLYQRKEIKKAWRGMVRNLEITHNVNPDSKDYNTYHPHFHMIAAVRPSYFTSRDYISQRRLTELWREALRVDYDPIVDVRRVRGANGAVDDYDAAHAVAECSKYAAKAGDYIIPDDWDLTVETVRLLDKALDRRRLINYSGVFREASQRLNLQDCEDGNLVHVEDDISDVDTKDLERVTYWWYSGYRQYYKIER